MRTDRPLNLLCFGKPGMREKLAAMLKMVAPHLTLDSISGDAEALHALLAKINGQHPSVGPLCSIRF